MKNKFLRIGKLKLGIEAIKEKLIKHASMYKTVREREIETDKRRLDNADLPPLGNNSTSPTGQLLDVIMDVV